jgi:hypothetical protein
MTVRTIIFIVTACLTAPTAPATTMLDQSQELQNGGSWIDTDQALAQTFTPSIGGQLSSIEVYVGYRGSSYPWKLSVVDTVNSAPSGLMLCSATTSYQNVGWASLSFQTANVNLVAGHLYGIIIEGQEPDWLLASKWYTRYDVDPYAGGASWRRPAGGGWNYDNGMNSGSVADRMFHTYMVVPEPSGLVLLGTAGIAWTTAWTWRRKRAATP